MFDACRYGCLNSNVINFLIEFHHNSPGLVSTFVHLGGLEHDGGPWAESTDKMLNDYVTTIASYFCYLVVPSLLN